MTLTQALTAIRPSLVFAEHRPIRNPGNEVDDPVLIFRKGILLITHDPRKTSPYYFILTNGVYLRALLRPRLAGLGLKIKLSSAQWEAINNSLLNVAPEIRSHQTCRLPVIRENGALEQLPKGYDPQSKIFTLHHNTSTP